MPRCSAILCWESLDPDSHADANWHQPSAQTPLQIKHTPHDTSPPAGQRVLPNHQKLLINSLRNMTKGLKVSAWPINAPDSNLIEHSWVVPEILQTVSCWGGGGCLGGLSGSENIHRNTRTQGFQLEHCTVARINIITSSVSRVQAGPDRWMLLVVIDQLIVVIWWNFTTVLNPEIPPLLIGVIRMKVYQLESKKVALRTETFKEAGLHLWRFSL